MGKAALNVFAGDVRVGRLDRSDVEEDEILFTYISDCTPQRAVSLTMPVRVDQYDAMGGLLPIFEMDAAATSAASRGDATRRWSVGIRSARLPFSRLGPTALLRRRGRERRGGRLR